MSEALLAGLRVVEFSAFVAAPSAGLTLAQLGAEVIRVDPLGGNIDHLRAPLNAAGASLYWAGLNRGKRSVELDVRGPAGRALLRRLVLAGEPPILLTNLGLDGELGYDALAAARPELIMVQLAGSPDGANAVDYTVNCATGFPLITGDGAQPVNHVLPAWDVAAGKLLALAVLAAERHWRRSGKGQLVRLTLSDVAMATACDLGYIADVQVNGTERRAEGNQLYGAYGDSFVCADGRQLMVAAISDRQFAALLRATGLHDALPRAAAALGLPLDTQVARYEARALISAALAPWFAAHTLAEVAAAFSDRALLWGPYRSFAQMLAEDPRASAANPMFRLTEHPGAGRWLTASTPLAFGAVPRLPPGVAPRLGEHTHAVLAECLGLGAAELQQLQAAGTIGPTQIPGPAAEA